MKKLIMILAAAILAVPANAQLLNRLADKAINAAGKAVEKTVEKRVEKGVEKATNKIFDALEKPLNKQVDKASKAVEVAAMNASTEVAQAAAGISAANDSLIKISQEREMSDAEYAALSNSMMSSYLALAGVGAPKYVDNGNSVEMTWDYVGYSLGWKAEFSGDKCTKSVKSYTFQTPELATNYYRGEIDGLEQADAARFSVDGNTVYEDDTEDYSDKDKVAVKAEMQQAVLAMGGKLE